MTNDRANFDDGGRKSTLLASTAPAKKREGPYRRCALRSELRTAVTNLPPPSGPLNNASRGPQMRESTLPHLPCLLLSRPLNRSPAVCSAPSSLAGRGPLFVCTLRKLCLQLAQIPHHFPPQLLVTADTGLRRPRIVPSLEDSVYITIITPSAILASSS
ncbi:hypothetical protein CBOM_08085 [Ceraceosorus bombacis]|uniref:Uncharacterized protein n=1 Tax=Ceraceosorus bombacis TaxID=401625 RepID=A0A0P1BTD3_9BASI|nr:hypothetical protein CBOM_08085 [Ceraceosorus bombacis]